MKAVLHTRPSTGFRALIDEARPDWLKMVYVDETDREGFMREITDAAVLLHVLEPVTADMIAAAPHLRLIQKIGVGVNTIDLDAARAGGVAVANMPGTNSQAVAEATLLLMLAALRRAAMLDRETRAGHGWRLDPDALDQVGEISGRTVGLVGYGAIARCLAPVLTTLGAQVLYTAQTPKPDAVGTYCALDDLLARADVVSLHLPLTPATEDLIDAAMIARMKPGAVLVNTARGGLVNEDALVTALKAGHLRAAGLDVFAEEPVSPDNPLLALDNVVVAPHVAWRTPETLARSIDVVMENCRRLNEDEPLLHRVL